MAKLILQFEGRMVKDYAVAERLTIGRMSDNAIVIDNPAVSGHHACVTFDGTDVVIEDLLSTNGTFVNEQPVTRHVLRHGDVVLVGKHHLVFETGFGDTVYLDSIMDARVSAQRAKPRAAKPTARTGVLRVLAGRADQIEFDLTAQTSLIGRSREAHVRLRGWFKPSVAVAIARSSDGYVATSMSGKTTINYEPMTGRHHLQEGDVLNVSGLVLEFRWKGSHPIESAACA